MAYFVLDEDKLKQSTLKALWPKIDVAMVGTTVIHESPFHSGKVTVWFTISSELGPISSKTLTFLLPLILSSI